MPLRQCIVDGREQLEALKFFQSFVKSGCVMNEQGGASALEGPGGHNVKEHTEYVSEQEKEKNNQMPSFPGFR